MLVPALTSLLGEASWWPGRRLRGMSAEEIVERVAGRTDLSWDGAATITRSTLAALSDRITPRERQVLARHLPRELRDAVKGTGEQPERFGVGEFLARARGHAGDGVSEQAMRAYAAAVLITLEEASPDDLAYVRAQLSDDYDVLFSMPPAGRAAGEPVSGAR